jgi:hypothetical protein
MVDVQSVVIAGKEEGEEIEIVGWAPLAISVRRVIITLTYLLRFR